MEHVPVFVVVWDVPGHVMEHVPVLVVMCDVPVFVVMWSVPGAWLVEAPGLRSAGVFGIALAIARHHGTSKRLRKLSFWHWMQRAR